jgi:D-alanine-D-alanine ligase
MTIVKKKEELTKAIQKAFRYSSWAILEKFIAGTEVTVAVMGDKALPIIEIVPKNEFYDFDSKYTPGHSDHVIPARIPTKASREVKANAVKAGKAMGCEGYYRVDFIVPKKGEPQILEVNTAPGMTATSLVPDAARAAGIPFPKFLKTVVGMALKRRKKD